MEYVYDILRVTQSKFIYRLLKRVYLRVEGVYLRVEESIIRSYSLNS